MILFDTDIRKAMDTGDVIIDPFIDEHLGVNSYDVRLDDTLLVYKITEDQPLDMRKGTPCVYLRIPEEGRVLRPNTLYLGSTVECVGTRAHYVPHLEGRSSVGRLGISVHITAGFGDVGFVGHWTLEITVVHPVRVYPGERIAQVYFLQGAGTPSKLYDGKYAECSEPIPSLMYRDKRKGK